MSIGIEPAREITIPRKRGETQFLRRLSLFAALMTILAGVLLYWRILPILSSLWLLFILIVVWVHSDGGLRAAVVDWLGAIAGRQFVCSTAIDGIVELKFGFSLLGHRFVQLQIPASRIAAVHWSAVPAATPPKCDLDDWTAWISFDHSIPCNSPHASIVPGEERGLWILGATIRREETAAFGRAFVQFLSDAGVKLISGAKPTAYVRADAMTARDTRD